MKKRFLDEERFNTPSYSRRVYDPDIKNEALLDDGRIVSYDQCCDENIDVRFGPGVKSFSVLGTGVIYSVQGVKQYPTESSLRFKFYKVTYDYSNS